MSITKLKELKTRLKSKLICGLYLKKGKKEELYNICIKYNIPITYPNLFTDNTHYYLWGISSDGIGLISTIIMNYLTENKEKAFQSLDALEEYLKGR